MEVTWRIGMVWEVHTRFGNTVFERLLQLLLQYKICYYVFEHYKYIIGLLYYCSY